MGTVIAILTGPQEGTHVIHPTHTNGRDGRAHAGFFAACAGNLGNVLGGVLVVAVLRSPNQLSGTIRSVELAQSQQISIQETNGQTVPVSYDNQTQVVYQNQNYLADIAGERRYGHGPNRGQRQRLLHGTMSR